MRKMFVLLLILCLVLGSVTSAFAARPGSDSESGSASEVETAGESESGSGSGRGSAAEAEGEEDDEPEDVAGTIYEDAVNVLMNLGVVSGYEDGTYRPKNLVTRAEMAVLIVNALGLSQFVTDDTGSSFSDMAGYGWAEGYVGYAQNLGVVTGYEDGTFGPERTVSYDEASTMLVAALGYTPASLTGSWPANYVSMARAKGILEGIVASAGGANRGDIAIMLYQTLDCEIGATAADGVWAGKNDRMLDRLGAHEYNNGKPFVVTDQIAKNESLINLLDYLGAYVTAYANKDEEILVITEEKSTFMKGKIKSGYFNSSSTDYNYNSVTFENGLNDSGAIVFENGEQTGNATDVKDLGSSNVTIAADLSGKNLRSIYSVSKWTMDSGEHGYYDSSVASEIEKDHKILGIELPEDNFGEIDYMQFSLFGVESLAELQNDDVLYVYYDSDKIATRITVGREVIEGKVDKMSTDDDPLEADFTVGNKKYSFADEFDSATDVPDTGDEIKAYLTYDGDFYKVEITDGAADKYAIVLEVSDDLNLDKGLSDNKIRLFISDGEAYNYSIKSDIKVKVDGEATSDPERELIGLNAGDIVEYGTNSKGEVDKINITSSGRFTTANTVYDGKMSAKGVFDGHYVNNNATIFTVSTSFNGSGSSKEADYDTGTLSNLLDGAIDSAIYIMDSNRRIDVMLIDSHSSGGDDVFGVPLQATKNTSDLGYERQFLVDGGRKTYNVNEYVAEAANTELYRLIFNSNGEVVDLELMEPEFEVISAAAELGMKTSNYNLTFKDIDATNEDGDALLVDHTNYIRGDMVTLDSEIIVYTRISSSSRYAAGKVRDIDSAVNKVKFYSICDGGIIDYVLVDDRTGGGRGSSDD